MKINQGRLRHETFDRRVAVYDRAERVLSDVMSASEITHRHVGEMFTVTNEAKFLFDEKTVAYLEELTNMLGLARSKHRISERNPDPSNAKEMAIVKEAGEEAFRIHCKINDECLGDKLYTLVKDKMNLRNT